jgi:hypothetical protein
MLSRWADAYARQIGEDVARVRRWISFMALGGALEQAGFSKSDAHGGIPLMKVVRRNRRGPGRRPRTPPIPGFSRAPIRPVSMALMEDVAWLQPGDPDRGSGDAEVGRGRLRMRGEDAAPSAPKHCGEIGIGVDLHRSRGGWMDGVGRWIAVPEGRLSPVARPL